MIPLLCLSLCTLAQTSWSARGFAPTFLYESTTFEGFEILIAPEIRSDAARRSECLNVLRSALRKSLNLLPPERLKPIIGTRIWLEWDFRNRGEVATYFSKPARELRELGVNPDKANTIEISNGRCFALSQEVANRSLLAAFSIAILDKALSQGRAAIEATYRRAIEEDLYSTNSDPSLWICATLVALSGEETPNIQTHDSKSLESRLYPTMGPEQYFAVLTLAYYNMNHFFPFNRNDLKQHDPRGAALMAQVWDSR